MIWFVVKSIWNRKLRSFLSSLGIAIGVFAILCMLSIGKGSLKGIEESIKEMGTDKIVVFARSYFLDKDIKVVEKIDGVEEVLPVKMLYTSFGPQSYIIYGIDLKKARSFFRGTGYEIEKGKWIKKKYECVLGAKASEKLEKDVGEWIEVMGKRYKVAGILKMTGSRLDDFSIIVSKDNFPSPVKGYQVIIVKTRKWEVEKIAEEIEEKLERERGTKDFEVFTQRTAMERLKQISSIFTSFFLASAAISLIVGCVGVMNSIFTSVHERIKIIGLLRALGASRSLIMLLFLLESVIICLIGFVIGVTSGTAFILLTEKFIRENFFPNYKAVLNTSDYIFCLFISVLSGIVSGILPARRASRIEPAEALRYE